MSTPLLVYFNLDEDIMVKVDASNLIVAGVLS
jgi:hypothetical protein